MKKKNIRIDLSLEELNEIYYVFAKTYLDKPYALANYTVVEKVMDRMRDELETINKVETDDCTFNSGK